MQSSQSEGKNSSLEGWAVCAAAMRSYDDEMVKGWNDEIDALLLLAGLISSVITTFLVQSFQLLQPTTQDSPSPGSAAIRVNALWSISLILALATALYGTLLKQWLREHVRWRALSPRDTVRLREIRREAFVFWGVGQVIAGLPTLIQGSLIVFFIGLLDYMWQILQFRLVSIPSTILIAIITIYFIATLYIPSFSPACAWKTAPGLWLRLVTLAIKSTSSRNTFKQSLRQFPGRMAQLYNLGLRAEGWWESDVSILRACDAARMQQLDENALLWAHRTILENGNLEQPSAETVIIACMNDIPPLKRATLLITLIADAASSSIAVVLDCGAHTNEFALAQWQHVVDGLVKCGVSTMERLMTYLLSILDAVGDPVQTLHVYVDTDVSLSREVNLVRLMHLLLVAMRDNPKGARLEQWAHVQETLIHLAVNFQSVAALQILCSFEMSSGVHLTLDDINQFLDTVLRETPAIVPHVDIQVEFFVQVASLILRQSSHLLPHVDYAPRKMCLIPRLRNLTRRMSIHLRSTDILGQRYHGAHVNQALWCSLLLALARIDSTALDWQEMGPALKNVERHGLLMAHEERHFRELEALMSTH